MKQKAPPRGHHIRGPLSQRNEKQKGRTGDNEEQERVMEQYISTSQLMKMLGISRSTVYRLMDRGMPFLKVGAINPFPKDRVLVWLGGE